ncbi:ATP-binding cassette domain-containing protein, partial [Streptomyces sp. NPDC001833]|uniref:ATP-binding cassette domain-containing protein n=1 Tax=Streptomyces sp. NPDC001833 TaxID=3154658 RepID=UPI003329E942
MTKKIVEIQDIKKEFNQKTVLSNITFSIKKNECIALLGKNGAGKSTLLNIIIGKYFQNDGNVKIYCEKKNVGFLPQNTNFPDDIKVNELINFVSSYTDTPLSEEEVALILNFSNEQMNKFASKLSGDDRRTRQRRRCHRLRVH